MTELQQDEDTVEITVSRMVHQSARIMVPVSLADDPAAIEEIVVRMENGPGHDRDSLLTERQMVMVDRIARNQTGGVFETLPDSDHAYDITRIKAFRPTPARALFVGRLTPGQMREQRWIARAGFGSEACAFARRHEGKKGLDLDALGQVVLSRGNAMDLMVFQRSFPTSAIESSKFHEAVLERANGIQLVTYVRNFEGANVNDVRSRMEQVGTKETTAQLNELLEQVVEPPQSAADDDSFMPAGQSAGIQPK